MKVLTIILGILLTICGIACIFSPGATFLATGYVLAVLLLVYGIIVIINVIRKYSSPIMLFAGIPAVIIGAIALFRPGSGEAFDLLLLYLFSAWFIVQGIATMVVSIRSRHFTRGWGFGLAMGIISVIVGGYSFAHPAVSAIAIGILVGIYFIEAGISLMSLAFMARNIDDAIETVGKVVQGVEGAAAKSSEAAENNNTPDNNSENTTNEN